MSSVMNAWIEGYVYVLMRDGHREDVGFSRMDKIPEILFEIDLE